ncbi:uncharacterized protein LOC113380268, partial [Ctenocephalides felis]|uniref:uncharacterized protein LOC113380268 n=1 Tax=Ctenocephalides felis TaxID=7515 RepID=UPI000E6E3220
SCLLDLSRFRTSAHGHAEFGGLNRVVMVRKLEERTFKAKNGQEIVTRETIETFRGNEKTDRKFTRLLKPNSLARLPSNLSNSLSEDPPLEEENFEQNFLRAINKLRNKHGSPNLHISDRLRNSSQILADSIAAGKSINDASKEMEDQNLGINVYWSSAGTPITPTRILAHWYGEGKNYISNRAESCDDQFRSSSEFDHSQSEHEMQEVSKKLNGTKSPHEKNVLHNGHGSNLKLR